MDVLAKAKEGRKKVGSLKVFLFTDAASGYSDDGLGQITERNGEAMRSLCSPPFLYELEKTTWVGGHVIMAAGGGTQSGRFLLKCSSAVELSEDGTTAWTTKEHAFGMVFSKEPIPTRHKFSVKVLKPAVVSSTWVS